ncbi:MAG: methyltransferase domain-containing protein [Planctomycetaceae bacterium]
MSAQVLDSTANQRFWESNQASYQGEQNARPLVFLTRKYLGQVILDAGAGEGSLVRQLRQDCTQAEVQGVDLAPKNRDVDQGDLTNLAYADACFDTVFCSEVIEHLTPEDTSTVMRELARVLRPGGSLIVTTPFAETLAESTVACPRCDCAFHRWGHQQSFVQGDFSQLADQAGLVPEEIRTIRYSRLRRVMFLGQSLLKLPWLKRYIAQGRGKRHLIMAARKPATSAPARSAA